MLKQQLKMNIEVKTSIKPIDYVKSMKILEQRVEDVFNGKADELLWIIEHTPTYTAGTSSNNEDLLDKKIKVLKTKRGGKLTYHGPGQKVVYFVLNLNKREKDIRALVTKIENCISAILKEYKIDSCSDKKNIGIWTKTGNEVTKVAAIGIRVKRWIAYHGFAINVSNNLDGYKAIVPCGIKDKGITSLKKLGVKNYSKINKIIVKKFLSTFL